MTACKPVWGQVVPSAGKRAGWVWQVWWDSVLVVRGEDRWLWVAMLKLWSEHRRAVRFVASGCGDALLSEDET